jgi:hypothetical protein
MTVLEAVTDPQTGNTLVQLLAQQTGGLGDHTANTDIHVTAQWKNPRAQSIGDLSSHLDNADVHVTAELKAAWNAAIQTAAAALAQAMTNAGNINSLSGRVSQIEDSLFNGITANPFTFGFNDLTGLIITHGIYNAALQRVEC